MIASKSVQLERVLVTLFVGLLAWASDVRAQSNVGAGALTSTLAETEPVIGVLSVGPVKLAPGIVIRELGWDSNVFDETEEEGPKEDFVAAAMPDVAIFSRLRFVKLSAYAGAELTYYQTYESERSFGRAVRGRADLLLSRIRPFIGGGHTKTRTRPNGEIDVRADRKEEEFSGGLAFDLGPHSLVYGSAVRMSTSFEDALQENVDLEQTLSRDGHEYSGGVKTDLTPLTSLTLYGGYREDKFRESPIRDSDTRLVQAVVKIGPDAVVSGTITVGFRDFDAVDPLVKPYRGVMASAAIMYPLLERGRLNLTASRGQEYSFDAADAYYIENSFGVSYTHRLAGAVDAQVRGGRSLFEYGFREGSPERTDTLDTAGGGLGYNLRNRTRVSINYEYARRRSPELATRNYVRRRAYLAWAYAF